MDTTVITILSLIVVGSIASLVLLVRAFQVSVGWGIACFLVPLASTIFGLCHFSRAKYSFLISHLSIVAVIVIIVRNDIPFTEEGMAKAFAGSPLGLTDPQQLTSMIQEKRGRIERLENQFHTMSTELTAQFADLNKKRTTLKATDTTAVEQFNAEAAAYDVKNKTHKSNAEELETTRKELQELLDERSRRSPQKKKT